MKAPVLIFLIFLALACVSANYLVSHEAIHAKIYDRYGADPKVKLDFLTVSGVTYISAEDVGKCNDNCKTHHAFNDIIGYNTAIMITSTWGMFIVYMAYRMLYHEYGQKKE